MAQFRANPDPALYRGDFLAGFYIPDAPEFENWVWGIRAQLREQIVISLHQRTVEAGQRQDYDAGISYAQHLLAIEPWREETHRHLMHFYARTDQRSAALAQYKECRQQLDSELGVEPSQETSHLYQRIRYAPYPNHNLPPDNTPLVGRTAEIAQLQAQLSGDHRLLTVVGAGGMGKTRLAMATARGLVAHFLEGVWWIDLTGCHPASNAPCHHRPRS